MIPPPYATVTGDHSSWTVRIGWPDTDGLDRDVIGVIYDIESDPSYGNNTGTDPKLVTWNKDGNVTDACPQFPLDQVPDASDLLDLLDPMQPDRRLDDLIRALAAFDSNLPAAVGHAMEYVIEDDDEWVHRVIVDPDMHEAAAKFYRFAQQVAATKSNVEPEGAEADVLDEWRLEIKGGFVTDWRGYVAQVDAERESEDD